MISPDKNLLLLKISNLMQKALVAAFVNEFLTIACSALMFQDRTPNEMSDDSDGKYRVFRSVVDSIFHENRHQTICSIFADIILALYFSCEKTNMFNIFSPICDGMKSVDLFLTIAGWPEVKSRDKKV